VHGDRHGRNALDGRVDRVEFDDNEELAARRVAARDGEEKRK
jgi:hypothetical protein